MTTASVGGGLEGDFFCAIARRFGTSVPALIVALLIALSPLGATDALARYASFVMEADNGRVLYSRNADTPNHPASLTKMMTLFLVFEALEKGKLTLDQRLSVSKRAEGQPPSKLGLKQGEAIAVEDAIRALAIKSANDVATVVAEALGGTEFGFGQIMTRRARELGMHHTTFVNASGLHNRRQLSTARDMAILAKTLIERFPQHYGYFSEASFRYGGQTYTNHNKLLGRYDGTDGIKTGYINASGFNLVASSKRNGVRLIGVVFGGKTGGSRDTHMQSLLDRSWDKALAATMVAARPVPKPEIDAAGGMVQVASTAPQFDLAPERTELDWGIQVGAFREHDTAQDAAAIAARNLQALPQTATIEVLALQAEQDTLFRARIMGMGEADARRLCHQVRNDGRSCVIITPDGDIQLAVLPR